MSSPDRRHPDLWALIVTFRDHIKLESLGFNDLPVYTSIDVPVVKISKYYSSIQIG